MKLTIGEKLHWDHGGGFVEELKVIGIESIDEILLDGVEVVPEGPDSRIQVVIQNSITESKYHSTMKLKDLTDDWEQSEVTEKPPQRLGSEPQ